MASGRSPAPRIKQTLQGIDCLAEGDESISGAFRSEIIVIGLRPEFADLDGLIRFVPDKLIVDRGISKFSSSVARLRVLFLMAPRFKEISSRVI